MNIGVVGNNTKRSLPQAVNALLTISDKYSLTLAIHDELTQMRDHILKERSVRHTLATGDEIVRTSDLIVAFGGDGTILSAARLVGANRIPILGINLGKLGFLAEASPEDLDLFFADIVRNEHIIEERSLLVVEMESQKNVMHALNEVVIDKSSSSRVIHLSVFVNNEHLVSFQGDGIIIATPTGSTGYALAAGGPIVVPTTDVVVIQPISPHSLSARTVIVPDTGTIRVVVENLSEHARVTADGQSEMTFSPPGTISIKKADYTMSLVKRRGTSYFDVLRAKLLWGSDIRLMKGGSAS